MHLVINIVKCGFGTKTYLLIFSLMNGISLRPKSTFNYIYHQMHSHTHSHWRMCECVWSDYKYSCASTINQNKPNHTQTRTYTSPYPVPKTLTQRRRYHDFSSTLRWCLDGKESKAEVVPRRKMKLRPLQTVLHPQQGNKNRATASFWPLMFANKNVLTA